MTKKIKIKVEGIMIGLTTLMAGPGMILILTVWEFLG